MEFVETEILWPAPCTGNHFEPCSAPAAICSRAALGSAEKCESGPSGCFQLCNPGRQEQAPPPPPFSTLILEQVQTKVFVAWLGLGANLFAFPTPLHFLLPDVQAWLFWRVST